MRSYTDLIQLRTFEERFEYLRLDGVVAQETFGFDRWLNQQFYRSAEWRHVRDEVILRDNGCDLGSSDHPIGGRIIVHHMNPIMVDDLQHGSDQILNLNYLISTMKRTHDAIHYGDASLLLKSKPLVRTKNDTIPWR